MPKKAPVAQLDRAFDFGSKGCGFKSCRAYMIKFTEEQIQEEVAKLNGWFADEETQILQKEFTFENFSDAMVFANKVGEIAEEENHHPDICVSYGSVVVMLTTHDKGGLTQKDFMCAARIEEIGK